jgi:hypothetical protein
LPTFHDAGEGGHRLQALDGRPAAQWAAFLDEYQCAAGRAWSADEIEASWAAGRSVYAFNAKKASLDGGSWLLRDEAERRLMGTIRVLHPHRTVQEEGVGPSAQGELRSAPAGTGIFASAPAIATVAGEMPATLAISRSDASGWSVMSATSACAGGSREVIVMVIACR